VSGIKCVNDATLSQISTCLQQASCSDFNTAAGKCTSDALQF
jgi:hypothetical protein